MFRIIRCCIKNPHEYKYPIDLCDKFAFAIYFGSEWNRSVWNWVTAQLIDELGLWYIQKPLKSRRIIDSIIIDRFFGWNVWIWAPSGHKIKIWARYRVLRNYCWLLLSFSDLNRALSAWYTVIVLIKNNLKLKIIFNNASFRNKISFFFVCFLSIMNLFLFLCKFIFVWNRVVFPWKVIFPH